MNGLGSSRVRIRDSLSRSLWLDLWIFFLRLNFDIFTFTTRGLTRCVGPINHTFSDQGTEILILSFGLCGSGDAHLGYGFDDTLQRIQETDPSQLLVLLRNRLVDEFPYQIVNDQRRI
jgi:hypothetical protein